MADLVEQLKEIYAAFGRGDVAAIIASMAEDVSWEFEAPAVISWGGIRRGPAEAAGFFAGIGAEHADPKLTMVDFVASGDAVAAFGRYQATVRATGKRVDTPVGHYFKFRDGKIVRYINLVNTAAFVEALEGGADA
jgi:ketosteroid isomerase-like protein